MKKIFLISTLIILLIIISALYVFENKKNNKIAQQIDLLWERTISKMLKDPLWGERDAYDAGHYLMVPMHYAFKSEDSKK